MSEQSSISAIQATSEDLERWRDRARRTPPEEPEQGSDLAEDDTIFPHHRISEAARLSLIAAGEHLRLAKDAIDAKQYYPSAHFTVLRGALVGSAQAVWMLAPDLPEERRQRGLTVIAQMYAELRKSYRDLERMELTEAEREQLAGQIEWCETRRGQVTKLRSTSAPLNQTEFIQWALQHRFKDTGRRQAGIQLWRQMSADAHVLGWAMFQRATFGPTAKRQILNVGQAGGDADHLSQPFVAAHLLLKEGWSLFDRRCEASNTTAH